MFVGAAERLLVCFCVVVWVSFSVFSIFSITSFGDYTRLQYQENYPLKYCGLVLLRLVSTKMTATRSQK